MYRAFKLAIEGQSLEAIATAFTLDGLPLVRLGRRGGGDELTWTKTTVGFLLKNRDVLGNKAKGYPGIISEHNFEMVQKALKAHRGGRPDNKNLFAGLLVCDECGTALKTRETYVACPRSHVKQSLNVLEAMVGEAVWGNMMYFESIRKVDIGATRSSNAALVRRHVKQIRISTSRLTITKVDGEVIEYPLAN